MEKTFSLLKGIQKTISIIVLVYLVILTGFNIYYFRIINDLKKQIALQTETTYLFNCEKNKYAQATFYLPQDRFIKLQLSDGRNMRIHHATSASGVRYTNLDESFVFWNKGDTAFIEENGKQTFVNCSVKDSASHETK